MGQMRRVVEAILRGTSQPARLVAADAHDARVLGVAAFTAGMGPLLGWWIEEGRVEASRPARDVLALHLRHGRRRSAQLRQQASRITRSMHAAGLRPILLKGMHTGGEFFPHPSTRPAADVDLLVPTPDHANARRVLTNLGFTETARLAVAPRSNWSPPDASTRIHSIELDHADDPWDVDLHEALERWYFRGTRRELGAGAFETSRFTAVNGERVRVLDQPYLTAFLALHTGWDLATVRLIRLVELVWVIRADLASRRLDWCDLATLLERTDTGRFAYPALALTEELAPGTVDADLLRRIARGTTPRMHRVLEAVRHAELGPLRERSVDVKLAWARGGREILASLSELVLPSFDMAIGLAETLRRRTALVRWRLARRLPARRRGEAPTRAPATDRERRP